MNILIIDDDKLVSLSLKTILEADSEIKVCALGSSGEEAIALYQKHRPDVLLMDIRMEGKNGLEAAAEILKEDPNALILFLTTFSDDEYIVNALSLGAKGYLLKQDFESIVPSLKAVYSGQSVFGGKIVSKLPSLMQSGHASTEVPEGDPLSEKEFHILTLVADGMNNKEIADELFLSEGTIRNYISTILLKLDLRDRTQLAIYYYKHYA